MCVDLSLFAGDAMPVGDVEYEEVVEVIKRVIGEFEERNNDKKEKRLVFESEGSGDIRMLGCWMGWRKDLSQRLAREERAWWDLSCRRGCKRR